MTVGHLLHQDAPSAQHSLKPVKATNLFKRCDSPQWRAEVSPPDTSGSWRSPDKENAPPQPGTRPRSRSVHCSPVNTSRSSLGTLSSPGVKESRSLSPLPPHWQRRSRRYSAPTTVFDKSTKSQSVHREDHEGTVQPWRRKLFNSNSPVSPNPPPRDPHGGKLASKAPSFFKQAYGLNGVPRKRHDLIIQEAIETTHCSERAIQETLYGHSYSTILQEFRDMIPGYPPKMPNRVRTHFLHDLLQNLSAHEFYRYDGNNPKKPSSPVQPRPKVLTGKRSLSFE